MIDEDLLYPYQRDMLRMIREHFDSGRPFTITPSGHAITRAHMQALGHFPPAPPEQRPPSIIVTSAKALGRDSGIVIIDDIDEAADTPEKREAILRWFTDPIPVVLDEGHFVKTAGPVRIHESDLK